MIFTADNIFNFFLLFDRDTRNQLSSSERQSSIMMCSILLASALMVAYAVAANNMVWYFWAAMTAISVFTVNFIFALEPGRGRTLMYYYFGADIFATAFTMLVVSFGDPLIRQFKIPDSVEAAILLPMFMAAIVLPMSLWLETGIDQFRTIVHIIKSRT